MKTIVANINLSTTSACLLTDEDDESLKFTSYGDRFAREILPPAVIDHLILEIFEIFSNKNIKKSIVSCSLPSKSEGVSQFTAKGEYWLSNDFCHHDPPCFGFLDS